MRVASFCVPRFLVNSSPLSIVVKLGRLALLKRFRFWSFLPEKTLLIFNLSFCSGQVYLVLDKMGEVGCDLFLDIHGDEEIPFNFLAGTEHPERLEALPPDNQCLLLCSGMLGVYVEAFLSIDTGHWSRTLQIYVTNFCSCFAVAQKPFLSYKASRVPRAIHV